MRLNFWSKKRAVESEYNWNLNPDPKYRMSSYAKSAAFSLCLAAIWASSTTLAAVNGSAVIAILFAAITVLWVWNGIIHIFKLDKDGQRDSERIIAATKRADGMAYELSDRFPDWPLEDIQHFVKCRVYP